MAVCVCHSDIPCPKTPLPPLPDVRLLRLALPLFTILIIFFSTASCGAGSWPWIARIVKQRVQLMPFLLRLSGCLDCLCVCTSDRARLGCSHMVALVPTTPVYIRELVQNKYVKKVYISHNLIGFVKINKSPQIHIV